MNSIKSVEFLDNFLPKEIFIANTEVNIDDFVKSNKIKGYRMVVERKDIKMGDIIYVEKNDVIHIVKPNQTIEEIALIYNTTKEDIIRKNNKISKLFVGEQIKI